MVIEKPWPGQVDNPTRIRITHDSIPIDATVFVRNPRVEQSRRIVTDPSPEIQERLFIRRVTGSGLQNPGQEDNKVEEEENEMFGRMILH